MISTSQSKLIRSLRQKKYRDLKRLYVVEGKKMVAELMDIPPDGEPNIVQLFATGSWIEQHQDVDDRLEFPVHEASEAELKKVSNLVTPQEVLALVAIPQSEIPRNELLAQPVLAFETLQDPGNLGTIMRTADWFGIKHLILSQDSVDVYHPKVVQSTMGSITRVKVHYMELEKWISEAGNAQKPVYGTFLEGENLYEVAMDDDALILFGNESQGLSNRYDSFLSKKISIPSFTAPGVRSESLNVASSVAVVCSELRRKD